MKRLLSLFLVFGMAWIFTGTVGGAEPSGDQHSAAFRSTGDEPVRLVVTPARDDVDDEIALSEDFEDGAEGWTTRDLTNPDTAWHKSDFLSDEDDLSWWCGDTITDYEDDYIGYNNIWLQYLDTPVLDLSGAEEGLTLTFSAYWLLEDPRRVPPPNPWDGWDGWLVMVSEDGGDNFDVLYPEDPEYTAERLSAAERFWDLGELPGWVFESGEWDAQNDTTPEPDWVDVTFDLSEHSAENVVIRFMLVSDRAVAAPWNYYLRNSGVLIDDILIEDDEGNIYLSNNCDDDPVPEDEDMIPRRGPGFGDWWERSDDDSHSGDWSMWHTDRRHNNRDALDSPPIEIPENMNTFFQYWVYCDLPDWDSNNDGFLDDFYQVFLSDDEGESWQYQHHDYKRDGAGGNEWEHYVPGTPFGDQANIEMDLTEWAGQTVQLRWLFISDNDDNAGFGDGMFLDDIEVIGVNRNPRDAGMENLHLPYPTTVGYRLTGITVEMHNYGIRNLDGIWAEWGWRTDQAGRIYPIVPRPSINGGEFIDIELTDYVIRPNPGWTPTLPGIFQVWTRTNLGSNTPDADDDDQNPDNDSTGFDGVRVWPADLFELGYENRTIQFAYPFESGTGPAARFSPADVGLEDYTLAQVHFKFNGQQPGAADFTLHILGEGDEAAPGEELFSGDFTVPPDSCLPNDMTIPLYENEELRGLNGEFWVWVELQREDNRPQIVGDLQLRGAGRYFTFDGQEAQPFDADLMMHAMVVPAGEAVPNLAALTSLVDFDEVPVGGSASFTFSLYSTGLADVTIRDVSSSDDDIFHVVWPGETVLSLSEAVSFEIVYTPPDLNLHMSRLIIDSDDEVPPEVDLVGSGVAGVPDGEAALPVRFGLSEPFPNPFNSEARIAYRLERAGDARLALYDLTGREVAVLIEGRQEAGVHHVLLRGDGLAAGMYLVKLTADARHAVRKVVLVK